MVFVSTGTERREGSAPVGEVGPVLFQISMEKDDGLWALWETAFFAVFQAPVGALFASMGSGGVHSPPWRCRLGSGAHERRGMGLGVAPCPPRPA